MAVQPSHRVLAADVCVRCHQPFVTPVDVVDFTAGRFLVELGCTNCGFHEVRLQDEESLEQLDRALDAGVALIADALHTCELEREVQEIDSFARALQFGAILPEDF